MSITRSSALLGLSVAIPALALAVPANAQLVTRVQPQTGATQVETLPPTLPPLGAPDVVSIQDGPITTYPTFNEERTIGPDGVETITRTRVIRGNAVGPVASHTTLGTVGQPLTTYPMVLEREQWLDECYRRVDAYRDGRRRKRDRDGYDCEAALDGYMGYYTTGGAVRTLPAPMPGYTYGYTGQYAYSGSCGCQQPQIALIPIRTETRQRVIVREQIRETLVPGERIVVPPPPIPVRPSKPTKLIKQ